ncbi:MAG TPA: helix-turn-helix domain-containing protein [Candidatus Bathyarchaeia archaeon]|nr:helix-turn-helix domain-containing protein [Candidatus Bathyarchaeia archaeon]
MIGSSLKRIRQKKKMTQQDLAEKLGVSRQAICLWEANKREVKSTQLRAIANILKVNVNELVRISEEELKDARFQLNDPMAKEVYLVGNFTNWEKRIPLRRSSDGLWQKKVPLRPGRYEYKFIVDGEWRTDPQNTLTVQNTVGTLNSVREL